MGMGSCFLALRHSRPGGAGSLGRADGGSGRRLLFCPAVPRLRLYAGFRLMLYIVVVLIGMLVGLEIPLLMRILKERFQFRDTGGACADLRLSRRAGRLACFSLCAGAAARPGALGYAVRTHQRGGGACGPRSCLPRAARSGARLAAAACALALLALGFGMAGARSSHCRRRRQPLRRRSDLRPRHAAISASC